MSEIESVVVENAKIWETFDRGQIEQIIQGNIRSVDEKMGQMMELFITSGYYLRRQYDEKMYLEAGYDRFEDYVKDRYGKSRSWATRMMQINEQYSIDGNDPRIDPKYKLYGVSQLQEMLYLTDEQREQASPDMTVKEIRALKTPAPVEEEQLSGQMSVEDFPEVMPEQADQEEIEDKKELLKKPTSAEREFMNSLARKLLESMHGWFKDDYHGRVLDVNSGSRALRERVSNDPSRCWYFTHNTDLCHANLFDDYIQLWNGAECIGNFDWFYLSASIQSMWNVLAMEEAQKAVATSQESGKNSLLELGLSERALQTLQRAGVTTLEQLKTMDVDDLIEMRGMSQRQLNEIKTVLDEQVIRVPETECCESEADEIEGATENLPVQSHYIKTGTLELPPDQVIDAEYTEVTEEITITPQSLLAEAKKWLEDYIKCDAPKNLIEKQKIYVAALAGMVCDLEGMTRPEPTVQPDLPVMKNNDQRKAFIASYTTWPIWIDIKETGERYYRYEFPEHESALVVKVYYHKRFDHSISALKWEDHFRDGWGSKEYYLMHPEKHFKDCSVNCSMLVDYLKEIQKK